VGGWSFDDEPPDSSTIRAAENAVAQSRRLRELIAEALSDVDRFDITVDMLRELNRLAVDGLVTDPGEIRQVDNTIAGSLHDPPPWQDVPAHLESLCTYLNSGPNRDPIHLAAYAFRIEASFGPKSRRRAATKPSRKVTTIGSSAPTTVSSMALLRVS
jgi:Fic family protein